MTTTVSVFFRPVGQKNTDASGLSGGNPDDGRPKPIGGPKEDSRKKHRLWTRGGVQRFIHDVHGRLSPKSAQAVAGIVEGGAGANHEYNRIEVADTADTIVDEHLKLGLTTQQAEQLAQEFTEGPKT